MEIDLDIPDLLLPLLEPARYKSVEGGRGSAKSHTIARLLLAISMTRQGFRVACCREIQKSIEGSVKKLFDDLIKQYGLEAYFDSQKTKITNYLGAEFTFHGLQEHRADDIKSLEGCDVAWLEEAQKVSTRSWQILTPTVRKPGSEIWATWNPDQESDEVYQRTWIRPWVPVEKMIRIKINWRDNPWYNEVLEDERQTLRALNDDLYQHVWEGQLRTKAGLLFKRFWFQWYTPDELPTNLTRYIATDYASTDIEDPEVQTEPDWTELGVWGLDEHDRLYALDWWSGQKDPEEWIEALAGLVRKHRPERLFEEKGPIYRATKSAVAKRLKAKNAHVIRTPLASINKKADRAMGFAAMASALVVYLPEGEPWAHRLIEQLCAFTGEDGKTDDMVDVCSILARGLGEMSTAPTPKPQRRKVVVPFTEEHVFATDEQDDHDQGYIG